MMAQDGDIVFSIGADVAGLTRAGQSGEKSLAEIERAAKTLERQLGKIGQSGVAFQREMNKLTGVSRELGKSARDSAAAFEAFEKSKAQVDNLRASIDPLFAASKRYEQALQTLDTALEQGTISARQHEQMVEQLGAAYLRADGSTAAMGGRMGLLGSMSDQTRGKIQQVGFQVQDFAVQVGAGTSATQAFAQQFPQLAGAFGPVGVAVGTLAAVGLPILGAAFMSAGEQSSLFRDALSEVESALNKLRETTSVYSLEGLVGLAEKYGEVNLELMRHIELQRQVDLRSAIVAAKDAMTSLIDETETWSGLADGLADKFTASERVLGNMASALRNAGDARTTQGLIDNLTRLRTLILEATGGIENMTDEQFAFYRKVQDSLDAVMRLNAEGAKAQGWIATATAAAEKWASALWSAARAAAAASRNSAANNRLARFNNFAKDSAGVAGVSTGFDIPDPDAGGGGGGGGANPVEAELEQLRQQLMTEEQLELESFAKRQEMLQQALEQRLLTQQEYAALMEQAQQAHADKMSEIDVWQHGSMLDKTGAFLGEMADALQGGNAKMLEISKKFGAAQALISAWQGAAEALKLPFPQNLAAFAKVLATGLSAVNAIKGTKVGGTTSGGRGGSGGAAAAPQTPVQTMNFTIQNDPFGYGERFARSLAGQMNSAQRNGSRIVATVTST